jgi:uncharacterized protein
LALAQGKKKMTVRLVPDRPLPPYSFVPGRFPHPVSDPAGHSFGARPPLPCALDPQEWAANQTYLYGLDLFNASCYWEAHVEFESLWLACGRKGVVAEFLKGLIKLAAAGVKHLEGRPPGVQSHAGRAATLWREVAHALGAGQDHFLGLDIQRLVDLATMISRQGWPVTPPLLLPQSDGSAPV